MVVDVVPIVVSDVVAVLGVVSPTTSPDIEVRVGVVIGVLAKEVLVV